MAIAFWILAAILWTGVACFWRHVYVSIARKGADPMLGALFMAATGIAALLGTLGSAGAVFG